MCAITGIFNTRDAWPIDEPVLRRMNDCQRHRGPDGEGLFVEPGAGLAHRRLSIIDVAGGAQPLFNEDGTVVVVFNGEIYNYRTLRDELRSRGHRFTTASDTEVLVHGWEEWGEALVGRLRGMFAFAVLDRPMQRLFLVRDRLGVKPLYYALLPNDLLLFASELKALLLHPGVSRAMDPCAVEEYFALGYVPDPRTILRSVHKLEPGHFLSIARGDVFPAPRRYWDVAFVRRSSVHRAEVEVELIDRLRDAVTARLTADVPLGAFLSGGVDSSAVVALMSEQTAEPVTTCSIAFQNPAFDESAYASRVASRFGTRHHVETMGADECLPVDALADLFDEPFADSSAIPTYQVSAIARRHVTVALSGDGGDESLAGYKRYPQHLAHERYRRMLPAFLRPSAYRAARLLTTIGDRFGGMPGLTTLAGLSGDASDSYLELMSVVRTPRRRRLFSASFRRDLHGYHAREVLRRHLRNGPADSPLDLVQYLDLKTYLPGDILTKVDRASMAHGLEVRSPFLDHHLVEWLAGVPAHRKLQGTDGKRLLKRALAPHLPAEVLSRPKAGFAVPLTEWLRGPLRPDARRALTSAVLRDSGIFDCRTLTSVLIEHESAQVDHSGLIWAVMVFEASLRRLEAGR